MTSVADGKAELPEPMLRWLSVLARERHYSVHTLSAYRVDLGKLVEHSEGLALEVVDSGHIRHWLAKMHGSGYDPKTLARILATWRGFYRWWAPLSQMPANPAQDIRAPKAKRSLPKALSVDQTQALLDAPAIHAEETALARRDRAILEVFYSSGLRLGELVQLDLHYVQQAGYTSAGWIDLDSGDIHVTGKGNKSRTVPVGQVAIKAVECWLTCRSGLIKPDAAPKDRYALFVGKQGRRIHPRVVQERVSTLARQADLPSRLHPHVLRHSFASHMLQSAQDLRAVQEMLGHANISTTQIYTQLDFQHLSKVYDAAHPRAGRKPPPSSSD
ncbi:tyrosine recombinase XerC [Orrella marina]|uniref:Tyrosine recombinase XerC n=1 Tax=Orrella marina TaxID=2163011 RepID=A0A2R4XLG2_9BURK|nr:tyrosine recombinase XerC [Orrella marina]AWB34569.1 tyrosine recombinase XerC [Orrella marina]